jgi:hypothetical protein
MPFKAGPDVPTRLWGRPRAEDFFDLPVTSQQKPANASKTKPIQVDIPTSQDFTDFSTQKKKVTTNKVPTTRKPYELRSKIK